MDTPIRDLQQLQSLQQEARELLAAGRSDEALATIERALAVEGTNVRSLGIKADAMEELGQAESAAQVRAMIRQVRREAWQRQVEAEIRGHHDLLGEAIRHETL